MVVRRSLAVLATATLTLGLLAPPGAAAPAGPWKKFGSNGKVVVPGSVEESPAAQDVLPDGRTYLVSRGSGISPLTIRRLRANGSLDPTFSGDGVRTLGDPVGYEDYEVRADPKGGVLVTAFLDGPGFPTQVWRLKENGALDKSFGTDGRVVLTGGEVEDLDVQADGRVVLAYSGIVANTAEVIRLTKKGKPDTSFGPAGRRPLSGDQAGGLVVQRDGRIVATSVSVSQLFVDRLKAGGGRDTSFGSDGTAVYDPPTDGGYTNTTVWTPGLVVRPSGAVVVTSGVNQPNMALGFRRIGFVVEFTKKGKPSPSFASRVLPGFDPLVGRIALQGNGSVVIGTRTPTGAGLLRLTASGSADASFSGDGFWPVPGAPTSVVDVGVTAKGRIITATTEEVGPDDRIVVFARKGDRVPRCRGTLATQFGTAGKDVIKGTRYDDVLHGLGGRDVLRGGKGDDVICGGPGRDRLFGGAGNDVLVGGPGKDVLKGGPGKDTLIQ